MLRFPRFVKAALQQPGVLFILVLASLRRHLTRRALAAARSELDDEHRRLERIVNHAPIGIVLVDADGRFVTVNPAFCEMLGYPRAALEGRRFVDFIVCQDPETRARAVPGRVSR